MSNNTQYGFAPSLAQERPKLASTGFITGIGEVKTSGGGDGDYEMIDLIFKPTRGSRKVFPRLFIRPEMFSIPVFSPKMYLDYEKFPALATVRPGKKKTIGETFAFMYHNYIFPTPSTNKKTGVTYADRTTALMAALGGTVESTVPFAQIIGEKVASVTAEGREPGDLGIVELTTDEIVTALRTFVASLPQVEQACVIKQSLDEDGNPKDQYELDSWRGPFNQQAHERFVKTATESRQKHPNDVSLQLAIGYRLN